MKNSFNRFWQARNAREKKVLIFCVLFLLLVFLYAYVWQPGEQAITRLDEILPQMRAKAALMHQQASEISQLQKHRRTQYQSTDLKSEIDASAQNHHLHASLSLLSVDNAGAAHLILNSISFNAWIRWLDALQQENHLRLESSHIETLTEPGMVKVDATLASWDAK